MNTAYRKHRRTDDLNGFAYIATHVPFVPPEQNRLNPWLATLASRNIPVITDFRGQHAVLWIPKSRNHDAQRLLDDYETANADWPRHPRSRDNTPRSLFTDLAIVCFLVFQTALFRFFLFVNATARRHNAWTTSGIWSRQAILGNHEWWRCITALTLHVDAAHALSNCIWGFILGALASSRIGTGFALLLMLLTGALGNGTMALFCDDGHLSLGASTMVFGLLGILSAIHTVDALKRREKGRGIIRLIPWVPMAFGVAMGGLSGSPDSDSFAHACGFAWGIALGAMTHACPNIIKSTRSQILAAVATIAVFAIAWLACF